MLLIIKPVRKSQEATSQINAALLDISCLFWLVCIYNTACLLAHSCCTRFFFVRHASAAVILSKVPTAKNALIALDYPLWYADHHNSSPRFFFADSDEIEYSISQCERQPLAPSI
jgi:hypothetical protein